MRTIQISSIVLLVLAGCHSPNGQSLSLTPSASPSATSNGVSSLVYADPVALSAIWANDGGDKVVREDTRASLAPQNVTNSIWQNSSIKLFGAKNEVLGFDLILESKNQGASLVKVVLDHLNGPNGYKISSTPATGDGVYNWTTRDIELFYVRYLPINGLSLLGYSTYDERHIPVGLERPYDVNGIGTGLWTDRPNHNKNYPDIAVPMEAIQSFSISQNENQSVWVDIYIPNDAPSGAYTGSVIVNEGSHLSYVVPVNLMVRNFSLPDVPSSKTMLNLGYSDIVARYGGTSSQVQLIRDRHFMMAHRHKISMIDSNVGNLSAPDQPSDEWAPRLDGSLFTGSNGYRGPGLNTGNGVFSVGTYGSWNWQSQGASGMDLHSNAWSSWFQTHSPLTSYFLYLIDESSNFSQTQTWALELGTNPGVGRNLSSMATIALPKAVANTPALQIATSTMDVGDTSTWNNALTSFKTNSNQHFYMYNGKRPASGSFMVDDDGVSLRELPWGQYKKNVDRWFYWESTYYNDFQNGRGETDVFNQAQTFGGSPTLDPILGETSGTYANGDGVLFYPGTDLIYPNSSYGLNGPIASLRLKLWRRGIQDVDYITLAAQKNPALTEQIVNSVVTRVLWENGVADITDPTWVRCNVGWSIKPDLWESARSQLADIIEAQ